MELTEEERKALPDRWCLVWRTRRAASWVVFDRVIIAAVDEADAVEYGRSLGLEMLRAFKCGKNEKPFDQNEDVEYRHFFDKAVGVDCVVAGCGVRCVWVRGDNGEIRGVRCARCEKAGVW